MKFRKLVFTCVLALACLACFSCVSNGDGGDDNDDLLLPNFVKESCSGCPTDEKIMAGSTVTGYRFYSYIKNTGAAGKVSMSIGAGNRTASKEFSVTAGTSYVFQSTVTVTAKSSASFTYLAKFPGTPGYTDTHVVNGYDCTGGPSNLQMNPR